MEHVNCSGLKAICYFCNQLMENRGCYFWQHLEWRHEWLREQHIWYVK